MIENFMTPTFDAGNLQFSDAPKVLTYMVTRLLPVTVLLALVAWSLIAMAFTM